MMFLTLFFTSLLGLDFFKECLNRSKYELRLYWYMVLILAMSDRTKKRTAPLLAAALYRFLRFSISLDVLSASFSFSITYTQVSLLQGVIL